MPDKSESRDSFVPWAMQMKGVSAIDPSRLVHTLTGAILGCGQGAVAVSLVLLMLSIFDQPSADERKASFLYKPVIRVAPEVFDYSVTWMPESKAFLQELGSSFEQLHPSP